MTFSQRAVEAAVTAWLEHASDYTRLEVSIRAALEAALAVDGVALVDQRALDWIFGEGPDRDGKWFGETIGDGVPKLAGKYPRTYWWRSKFRALLAAASEGEERNSPPQDKP